MVVNKYKCTNTDCYASNLDDSCLLKRRKYFGYCGDYYTKIKSENDEIFSHLFHKHNLKTRKYSIIAMTISTIALVITCYSIIVTSNFEKRAIEKYLNDTRQTFMNIKDDIYNKDEVSSKTQKLE